jgi:integrase
LGTLLKDLKQRQPPVEDGQSEWVFPSPRTGHCYSDSAILSNYLKPAAAKLGILGFGWHTFRHSYKSWLADAKVNPAEMKDLMCHSDIPITMDVYGHTLTPALHGANALVAKQIL